MEEIHHQVHTVEEALGQQVARTHSSTFRDLRPRNVAVRMVSHQHYLHHLNNSPCTCTTSATSRTHLQIVELMSLQNGWHEDRATEILLRVEEPVAVGERPHHLREETYSSQRCQRYYHLYHLQLSRRRRWQLLPTQALLPLPSPLLLLKTPPLQLHLQKAQPLLPHLPTAQLMMKINRRTAQVRR